MLALLVALSLSQVTPDSRVTRVERVPGGRMEGGRGGVKGWAFFEAFPVGGAGVGSVAPLPNWVTYSEQLDNAAWTSQFAPSAITVTANASGAMERLQIPATTGAQYALLYQNAAVVLAGPLTISADVRGVGGTSGTFKLGVFNGVLFYYGDCAFTAALTRCSVPVSFPAPTLTRVYLGNDSANIVGNPAQAAVDVYVGSVQLNVGSTAAPYIATTTAAAGYMPTGAKGEAMTFSRTGTAMATRTASGGLATSGIANGDLVLMPANAPRVEYDSAGTLGLLVESSRTNSALRSQELDNATWTATGTVSAPPTVTANYAVAPDGTTTAERIQFAACPGVGDRSVVYQTLAANGVSGQSVFLRGTSGSGSISMCYGNTPGSCSTCSFVSDSWSRCTRTTVAPAVGTYFFLGCDNETAVLTGASNTGAADVLVWGAQLEAGTYATSYIPTTSAAVTRNVETASFQGRDLSGLVASASTAATLDRPKLFDSAAINLTATLNTIGVMAPYLQSNTGFGVYSGAIVATQAVPALNANTTRLATSWSGTTFSSWYAGNQVSAAGTAFAGTQTVVQLCDYNTSHSCDGIISRVCIDPIATRCR